MLNSITSIADCDALLDQLNDDREVIENKKQNLIFKSNQLTDDALDFQALLDSKKAELEFDQPRYEAMPPSERKEIARLALLDLQSEIGKMELKKDRYGAIGSVLRELSLNNAIQQLAETDLLITQVTAYKAGLAA